MFMLFFADVGIFARPPFKIHRSHLNDIKSFLGLAVFLVTIRDFAGSEWDFSIPGSKIKAKKP